MICHPKNERKQKGAFGECALVPVLGVQEYQKTQLSSARVALQGKTFLEAISVQGNICQNQPCDNHTIANPRKDAELRQMTLSSGNSKVPAGFRVCLNILRGLSRFGSPIS